MFKNPSFIKVKVLSHLKRSTKEAYVWDSMSFTAFYICKGVKSLVKLLVKTCFTFSFFLVISCRVR
jgi:hypothetical protein